MVIFMHKFLYICILLFIFSNSLFSQILSIPRQRQQPVVIWGDDNLAIIEKLGTVIKLGDLKHGGFYQEILPRPNTIGVSMGYNNIIDVRLVNDKFYWGKSSNGAPFEDFEIEIGRDPEQRGFPARLYETDRPNLYFAINVDTGFIKNGEASCCSWWKSTERGSLYFDRIIPIKWIDEPALLPVKNNGKPVYATLSKTVPGLGPFLDAPIRIPGAFIIVSWKAGILWVIKDGSISPDKVIDLIGMGNDFIKGLHPFPCVILGIQPLKNGKLLVAKRSHSAVFETYKEFDIESKKINPPSAEYMIAEAEQRVATIIYPEIEWIEVSPLTGEINKPDDFTIVNAPILLKKYDDIFKFTFGFDPSGRLTIPWVSPLIEIPSSSGNQPSPTKSTLKKPQV